jgi:two-component system, response regulator YesN
MLTALIVDDERMTRDTLLGFVPWAELGIAEVDTARDGLDALAKIERRMPDLVVCDIRMPRLGGIEFAQIVRQRNPQCGIIFLSGYSEKEYLKAAIRLHAADYIDKPVNLAEIRAAVERNVRALRERADTSAEAERTRRVLTGAEPLLRASLAAELVRPGAIPAALRARFDPQLLEPFLSGPLRTAVAELEPAPGRKPEAATEEVVRALNEGFARGRALAAWAAAPERVGLVMAGAEAAGEHVAEELATAVARAAGGRAAWVGLGQATAAVDGVAGSWDGALAALAARFHGAAADRRIARIQEYVLAHHADPDLLVETIALDVGLSESYLCTLFKQACGVTVKDHVTRVRIERAKELLRASAGKLHAVALQVGFRDANYFSTVFKREVGLTPREYRERAQR